MRLVISILLLTGWHAAFSQKFIAEKSTVTFFSKATIEDITASNDKAASLFNTQNGEIAVSIPINEFKFHKALMQEHFNEKYLESEKFPKSTFQGTITGYQSNAAGQQAAKATGKLTIHGVTKDVETTGTIEFTSGKIIIQSKFIVKLEDYNVTRPQILWKNIAEEVEVTIDITYIPYEKK